MLMLVAIDVGNTNITIGIFDGDEMVANFRLTTGEKRTADEFVVAFYTLFQSKGIDAGGVTGVIVSSVVPKLMFSLEKGVAEFFGVTPVIVGPGIKTGISVATENPKEVGADRIVDLVAGHFLYGGPLIVIDFGTATTYDFINANGEFEFGLTAPGIETAAHALWSNAAKLPEIEIRKPASIRCRNTITSMQGGLVFGYIGQTEYIIKKIKDEVGDARVIATGGLGKIIYNETDMIDEYDGHLTFKGMKFIYERNK